MSLAIAVLTSLIGAATGAAVESPTAAKPNVVIVLVDDQGFADLGCRGNPMVRTPQMDRFAKESIELTQFYSCPVCSPSRAELLTGRNAFRTGVTDVFGTACRMRTEEVTLAETLRAAGYTTGIFGKWHLGDDPPHRPQDQGFDETLTYPGISPRSYFDPTLLRNGQATKFSGYCMDIFTDQAIAYIRANRRRPLFVYLSANLIHTPLSVAETEVAPFRAAGLDDKTAKVYAMLKIVDDNFGKLLAALKEMGLEDNTLVWLASDNGPCTGSTTTQRYMAGLRGLKGTVYENGIRVPCFVRWPRALDGGKKIDRIAALIDVMPTVLEACGAAAPGGPPRDGLSLLPLLRDSQSPWNDRTLFFQWEGNAEPRRGMCFAVRNQQYKLVQAVGIADRQAHIRAKYVELCVAQGRGQLTVDGPPRCELFDIAADPGETKDLAAELPGVVERMKQQYERWFDEVWGR